MIGVMRTFRLCQEGLTTRSKCFKTKIISEYMCRSQKSMLTVPQSLSILVFEMGVLIVLGVCQLS